MRTLTRYCTYCTHITGSADRVISIEMFEHMKNYQLLMHKVSRWIKPGGKVSVLCVLCVLCHCVLRLARLRGVSMRDEFC
jgi:hypothetical protein